MFIIKVAIRSLLNESSKLTGLAQLHMNSNLLLHDIRTQTITLYYGYTLFTNSQKWYILIRILNYI
jgi:hypothetical protein